MPREVVRIVDIAFFGAGGGAAAGVSVGVENDFPVAGGGQADAIAFANGGCQVEHNGNHIVFGVAFAQIGNNRAFGILEVDPVEAFPRGLNAVEGGLGGVEVVEFFDECLQFVVWVVFEQVPVEAVFCVPFFPLPEFAAHEEEFFSGVGEHVAVE